MLRKVYHKVTRYLARPVFASKDVVIGKNVHFGKNIRFNCEKVRIGDGCVFQDNITINATSFEIGDYATVYSDCFFPGPGKLKIGHNCWIGKGAIVDCKGGTSVGNNVCIGVYSQLWSHAIFGDVMVGCRFNQEKPLIIEDDVWIMSGSLIAPVRMKQKSMAMTGAMIVKDTEENHVYGGVPAKDITEKMGPQFKTTTVEERKVFLKNRLEEFAQEHQIKSLEKICRIVDHTSSVQEDSLIQFNVESRTYTKTGSRIEQQLIRFLLPDIKFIPAEKITSQK